MNKTQTSQYSEFLARVYNTYSDPGIDYLQLLLATPASPSLFSDHAYKKAFQTRLQYTTAVNNYWKYGLSRIRTMKLIEAINRDLHEKQLFSTVFSEKTRWGTLIKQYLYPVKLPPHLKKLTTEQDKYYPWIPYQVPQPYPTNNLFRELMLQQPLPAHDWRVAPPSAPYTKSPIPLFVAEGAVLLTFELTTTPPYHVKTLVFISLQELTTQPSTFE